ncbi:O-antigen ligase family protein [Candidatus Peregrinibacteria bacterium]|nr:MAG: O-antigen ligase family protein [Candidatus Peregrinibacteria bacterium]
MKKILPFLLGLNLFFLQSYLLRFSFGFYPSNLQEILILAAFFCLVVVKGPRAVLKGFFGERVLLIFVGLSLLSLLWLPLLDAVNALRFAKFVFFGTLLAVTFLQTYSTDEQRWKGLKILSYGALCFGLFSVLYNALGFNVMLDGRLAGPLDSAVYLAIYLIPALLFFAFELVEKPKRLRLWIPFLITGLLILATRSFGAMGGALGVLGLYGLRAAPLPFFKTFWFKGLVGVLGLIFLIFAFYVKILPTLQTDYSSLDERGQIWQTTAFLLEQPRHFFLGLGLGQFQMHYEQNVAEVLGSEPLDYVVLQPHNVFLLFWVNHGLLGLLFSVFLLGHCLWTLFTAKKSRGVRLFATYVLLYFLIHGLIDTPWFKNDLFFYLLLFSNLSFGASNVEAN